MSDKETIRRAVENAVRRHLQNSGKTRAIIDADAVEAIPEGGTLPLPPNAVITPLAEQTALERHVTLAPASTEDDAMMTGTIAIGADHGGYAMKEMLKKHLQTDFMVTDCGTHGPESVDYPDFALAVAKLVGAGRVWRGIIIDGAGIGSCMAANKVPGVRAAMCYDQATASNSREHNNANVLTLGAGLIGDKLAQQIVDVWLKTPFGGGRHARRVNKIMEIERKWQDN